MVGDRLDAVGRGFEDLDGARLGVGALGLADDGAHAVARDRAGDEDHVAVLPARDAVAAVREAVDGQLELGPARGPGGGGGGGRHAAQDGRPAVGPLPQASLRSIVCSTDLRFALRRS